MTQPPLPDDWCYSCGRSEPMTPSTYRVCPECFHVYETAADLVAADQAAWADGPHPPRDPDKIYSCPECAHDF